MRNHTQLIGGYGCPMTVASQAMVRSRTPLSSLSHSHGLVSWRMSATEAASTFAWPSSSGLGHASGWCGSVPAARPSA